MCQDEEESQQEGELEALGMFCIDKWSQISCSEAL